MAENTPLTQQDIDIVRELARQYAAIALTDRQKEIKQRMYDTNDLKLPRPLVLLSELPWHELNVDGRLEIKTQNPLARRMEGYFRRSLLQAEYFPADQYFTPYFPMHKAFYIVNNFSPLIDKAFRVGIGKIESSRFDNTIQTEEDVANMKEPIIQVFDDMNKAAMEGAHYILDGIVDVRPVGMMLYYAPWDDIPTLHGGVTEVFFDMKDRPEFLHALIQRITGFQLSIMDQYEKLGLLDAQMPEIHSTPGFATGLPASDYIGGNYRLKDVWFRSMAQMFTDVSPQQHMEFDLQYSIPLFDKCGLGYYGCCEALEKKIDLLRKIPNLRKIGVSPWANVESCAEQIGTDYVVARKPNPAHVAVKTDPEVVRAEVMATYEACARNHCTWEYVLKDISTVSGDIHNLVVWENTVMETLDQLYG